MEVVKRRQTKKEIHALEARLLPVVRKYFRAGSSVHRDIIYRMERQMEALLFPLLKLHLRLDPSWPERERWLDYFENFSWGRSATLLRGESKLWWEQFAHVGRGHGGELLEVSLGTYKRRRLVYLLRLGGGGSGRCFSNCGHGISYKRRSCR